ncbi:MAG: nucleotidyltransferase family protein, partial [Prevotella sp.]|nr:nucleotidyltransferase family protein [Prevotella sp.]
MNVVNDLFFELLQVAIGNRQSLSREPIPEEWEEIYEMSKKQSLAGIAFAGVERLPQEQMPPGKRIRQWAVKAEKIREHNVKVSEDCRVISRFFEENDFDCVILKGQGNFAYYPEWLQGLRSAGDIDVWCWPKGNANDTQSEIATKRGYATTKTKRPSDYENDSKDNKDNKDNIELARSAFEPASATSDLNLELLNQRSVLNSLNHPVRSVIEFCLSKKRGEYVYYHNLDFPVLKATPVEVHYRPTWLYNPFRNRVLQRWFASQKVISNKEEVKS